MQEIILFKKMYNGYWCNHCKVKWWMPMVFVVPQCKTCNKDLIKIGSDGINGEKEYL